MLFYAYSDDISNSEHSWKFLIALSRIVQSNFEIMTNSYHFIKYDYSTDTKKTFTWFIVRRECFSWTKTVYIGPTHKKKIVVILFYLVKRYRIIWFSMPNSPNPQKTIIRYVTGHNSLSLTFCILINNSFIDLWLFYTWLKEHLLLQM